jgi:CBS domain-containing protein
MGNRDQDTPRADDALGGRFYTGATRRHRGEQPERDLGERMDYGRSPWWGGNERRPARRRPEGDHRREQRAAEWEPIAEPAPDASPLTRAPRWEREGFEQQRLRGGRDTGQRLEDEIGSDRPFPEDFRSREWHPGSAPRTGRWQREPLTATEIMTRDPRTVTPEMPLAEVASLMKSENCGIVPVVDAERRLLGVVTDRDLVMRTLAEGRSADGVVVRDVMTDDVEAVTAHDPVRQVIELMGRSQVRRIPVVDRQDRLLGIISMADVANRADYDEDLQDALERISARRSFWARVWS